MSGEGAPKKRRRWIWWVVLGVVVVAAAAAVFTVMSQSQNSAAGYTTAQVARRNVQVTVSGSGNAVVASTVQVDPGVSGTVYDLSVKLGEKVETGQRLFRLENADLDSAVEQAEVSYNQANQQLAQAQASLTQANNDLYDLQHPSTEGSVPPKPATSRQIKLAKQQVTAARRGLETADESLGSASINLTQAEGNAAKRTVVAPVDGVVTVLNAQNGQALGTGGSGGSGSAASSTGSSSGSSSSGSNAAVEISDMGTLRARVQINEVDLINLKNGQQAIVTFDALPSYQVTGTVVAISPTGLNTSGVITYDVDLKLKKVDPRLRPDMSCTGQIVTAEDAGVLVVPSTAVSTANGASSVQVFDIGATAPRTVQVTIGSVVDTTTVIDSGLKEGQYVVTGSPTGTTGASSGNRGGAGGILRFGGGR